MFTCPKCGKEYKFEATFKKHLEVCNPGSESPESEVQPSKEAPQLDYQALVEQVSQDVLNKVSSKLNEQLGSIVDSIKQTQEAMNTKMGEIQTQLTETVTSQVSEIGETIAQRAQAELESRLGQGGGAGTGPTNNPILQAILARALGGGGGEGDLVAQATKIGQAFGTMLAPIAQIQQASFGQALRLIDIASKFPTMTSEEKGRVITGIEKAAGLQIPGTEQK